MQSRLRLYNKEIEDDHTDISMRLYIIVDTNQPATFSTADAMFVSRCISEPNNSGRVFRRTYLSATQTVTHVGEKMASGDVWSVLEECLKKINVNTAQPENFLRQVFAVCMFVLLKKLLNVVYACLKRRVKN